MIPGLLFAAPEPIFRHPEEPAPGGTIVSQTMSSDGMRAFVAVSGVVYSYGQNNGVWTARSSYTLPDAAGTEVMGVDISAGYSCLVVTQRTVSSERGFIYFFSYDTSTDAFTLTHTATRSVWAINAITHTIRPGGVRPSVSTDGDVLLHSVGEGLAAVEVVTRVGAGPTWTSSAGARIGDVFSFACAGTSGAYLAGTVSSVAAVRRYTDIAGTPTVAATYTPAGRTSAYGTHLSSSTDGTRVAISDPDIANGFIEVRVNDAVVFSITGNLLPLQETGDAIPGGAVLSGDGNTLFIPAGRLAGVVNPGAANVRSIHAFRWNGSTYAYFGTTRKIVGEDAAIIAFVTATNARLRTSQAGRETFSVTPASGLRFFTA